MKKDKISKSSQKIRKIIDKAIKDGKITLDDYDKIIHIATEDDNIDNQESILIKYLNELIYNKEIKIKK